MVGRHPMPPRPVGEYERLRELYRRRALGSGRETVYDDVAALASLITGAPVGAVNLVDADDVEPKGLAGTAVPSQPREFAVCAYTILGREPLVIPDLARDSRTSFNPLLSRFGVRSYAGAPIVVEGHVVGTVCVFDRVPRTVSTEQVAALETLARQAAALLGGRTGRQNLGDALAEREREREREHERHVVARRRIDLPSQRRRIGTTAGVAAGTTAGATVRTRTAVRVGGA